MPACRTWCSQARCPRGHPPAARRCVSVGPFNDLAQETRALSLLQERGFTPQQRAEEGDIRDGFWVYVGGIKTPADETKTLRALQDAGIADARAMGAADDGRRVSVGLFTDRSRAERRARGILARYRRALPLRHDLLGGSGSGYERRCGSDAGPGTG